MFSEQVATAIPSIGCDLSPEPKKRRQKFSKFFQWLAMNLDNGGFSASEVLICR